MLCQWLHLPRPYQPRQCKQLIQLLLHTLLPLQDSFLLHLRLPTTFQDIPLMLMASLPPPGPLLLRLIHPYILSDWLGSLRS